MSRNLNSRSCVECGEDRVEHIEVARKIRPSEAGRYYDEFIARNLHVCEAVCDNCATRYLAWVTIDLSDKQSRDIILKHQAPSGKRRYHFDLSYRGSFNDEPAPADVDHGRVMLCKIENLMCNYERPSLGDQGPKYEQWIEAAEMLMNAAVRSRSP